ncbi:MAG TPA: TetR/AcrR family transcriptional regulator [Bacillota bacterium]|nr:TetR/AcrR family transcriptional regulator [Bacillota bacterium]
MTHQRQERMRPARRWRLVLAAATEFAEHGFEQASVNRILAACGMSKSSLYHVVDSKADLLDLVVRDLAASIAGHWSPPAPDEFADDFWGTAGQVVAGLGALAATDTDFGLLGRVFHLSADSPATGEVFAAVGSWLDDVLAVGRRTGAVDDGLPADLQAQVVLAVLRAFDEWTLRHVTEMDGPFARDLVDHQLAALRRLLTR